MVQNTFETMYANSELPPGINFSYISRDCHGLRAEWWTRCPDCNGSRKEASVIEWSFEREDSGFTRIPRKKRNLKIAP